MEARLKPKFANLTVYTETAVGGPEQVAVPMWLVLAGGNKGVGSHLAEPSVGHDQEALLQDDGRGHAAHPHLLRPHG